MLYYYFISNALFPKVLDPKEIWRSGRKTAFSIFSSVQISHSVVSDSLQPHILQHARLPCPSPAPESCLNSCHRVSDIIQPFHSLSSLSPPAFNLSQDQGLCNESVVCIRRPKYWRFSFSIS